jgi:ABC-2 type transport system permease protein
MKKYFKLYPHYLAMAFKSKMIYRADWAIGLLGLVATNVVTFLTLYLSTLPVQSLGGWKLANIMYMYGFLLIPMGIDHMLTDKLWNYGGGLINQGELDRILMKPLNPLFQMCAEYFQEGGLGEVVLGITFMAIFGPQLTLSWDFNVVFPIVVGAAFSPLIYFAIKLWTMSIAFYNRRSISIMSGVYNIKEYGKYPASIYHTGNWLGEVVYNVLLFILPFGLIGYLPLAAQMFPGQDIPLLWFSIPANNYLIMGIIIAVSLVLFGLSYLFFSRAIKHYNSAGA